MGKKGLTILFALLLGYGAFAQKDTAKGFVHAGLLRAAATFSIGIMPSIPATNAYLTGNLEYYADSKISVRGDVYYFFNSLGNNNTILKQNQQLYFGACYNIPTSSNFNPFIGLQPGVALIQLNTFQGAYDNISFSPLASALIGFNYYAEKWFHILVNVRYAVGMHLDEVSLFNVNEVSFSFGLGWNLDVVKNPVIRRTVE